MDFAHAHIRYNQVKITVGVEQKDGSVTEKLISREKRPETFILGHIHDGGHQQHEHEDEFEIQWIPSYCGELEFPMPL